MRVLVACEFFGAVRDAFRAKGCDAWSCDILEGWGDTQYHIQDDVKNHLNQNWDLIIAHPPCTHLAVSGNRYYSNKPELHQKAVGFATMFFDYAEKVCVENPVGRLSTLFRKPDQYIQPWMFGHREVKKTGLWLKNLPLLHPEEVVEGPYEQRIWKMGPSKDRGLLRSITYQGIADAMANQWT